MLKTCSECKQEKALGEFSKNKRKKDGLRYECKECSSAYGRKYYQANRESLLEKGHEYYKENHEKVRERTKNYRDSNWEKVQEDRRKYREANIEKIRESSRMSYKANPEQKREYYEKNREWIQEKERKRRREKPEEVRESLAKWRSIPKVKFTLNLRNRVVEALKSGKGSKNTLKILGASSFDIVREHIEEQFQPGMSWENYGRKGWHCDHIRPLATARNEKELLRLCHYENLQPLWAGENHRKSSKFRLEDMFKHYYFNGAKK